MDINEAIAAFHNPSWWVLTVIVGLFLNVFAPFINKGIESIWASYSKKKSESIEHRNATMESKVARLAKKESGLLEAKIEATYWAVRIVLSLSIYLVLIQIAFSIPMGNANLAAIPIALAAFLSITKFIKRWTDNKEIHNLLLRRLNQEDDD
ncbi:MAG: hypothetical protein CVU31_18730 [Betaproteobacteria bacterium HGW-Betaproteobacteria-4]|jgi:hypothetical protein|nr:MAG: hypothetical protein CVU31_18730 [Betaproteobacteria bacterium HGW-Betaproteobacteria-4]